MQKKTYNLSYLCKMMGDKGYLIREMIDDFLKQVPEDLLVLNASIIKIDYATIKSVSHALRSSVSIMCISSAIPILQEIENFGTAATCIEKVKILYEKLNDICKCVFKEMEIQKHNYV